MYDWLREQLRLFELGVETEAYSLGISDYGYETGDFINWLEATGATLSVGRVGPLQETPMLVLPDEYYDNVEGE